MPTRVGSDFVEYGTLNDCSGSFQSDLAVCIVLDRKYSQNNPFHKLEATK
jgi:hypothetical protein